jgi:hypothetical protein
MAHPVSWAETMVTELYRVVVGDREVARGVPLAEAPIGPGHEAVVCHGRGPSLYTVPEPDGGYAWVEWTVAAECGWSDRCGLREYLGEGVERRFLVLYYPRPRRAWPALWRRAEEPPARLDVCRSRNEAEWTAGRWLTRRQVGFHTAGVAGLVAVWGWDDREIDGHEECWDGCGCDGPRRGRDYVLIAEFEDEAAAMQPDVRLEREAWMAGLDVERAMAVTAHCEGVCSPACGHCSARDEEIDAAWEWLSRHQREVRAWRRERRRGAAEVGRHLWTMPGPAMDPDQPGGGVVQTAPRPQGRNLK